MARFLGGSYDLVFIEEMLRGCRLALLEGLRLGGGLFTSLCVMTVGIAGLAGDLGLGLGGFLFQFLSSGEELSMGSLGVAVGSSLVGEGAGSRSGDGGGWYSKSSCISLD